MGRITRRGFLQVSSGAAVALGSGALSGALGEVKGGPVRPARRYRDGPLRVGHIGVGGRGSGLLGEVLGIEGVEVVAICDTDPRRREAACRRVELACGKKPEAMGDGPYDYRRLLARDDIHCAVMATPCYWHAAMYTDALEAGMHFYGEKPLAISARGVQSVLDAHSRHRDVSVQIGFQWGAHRGRQEIFRRIHDGAIGELLAGRFHRLNGWDHHGGWYAKRALSGDWMLEQAVHEFNLIWSVVRRNPLKAYAAACSGVIPGRDTTNYYTAILQYPGRLAVHYSHGWIEVPGFPGGGMRTEFVGTEGAADILGAYLQLRQAPPGGAARIQGQGGGDTKEHFMNLFHCVRAGTPGETSCGIQNGVGASIIGLMIRKSIEEKREVTIDETMRDEWQEPVPPA